MLGLFVRAFSCDRVVFSSCLAVLLVFFIIHGFVVNNAVLLCGFKQTKGKRHENSDSFDRIAAGIGCGVCVGDLWPLAAGGGGMTKDEELAMDLALEALESCEWGLGDQYFDALLVNKAITAIKQARSAPVQEPVAVVKVLPLGDGHKPMHWADWTDADNPPPENTPLYTTPPAAQRQWVGLTDDEFENIELGCRSTPFGKIEAMRKVEAKLKEKNGGVV